MNNNYSVPNSEYVPSRIIFPGSMKNLKENGSEFILS